MGPSSNLCLRDSCAKIAGHQGSCNQLTLEPLQNLPAEIVKKIDKTTMTRGAQPYGRVPFQNRVRRWNRAIVPFDFFQIKPSDGYENGKIILVRPEQYLDSKSKKMKSSFPKKIIIGDNAFIFYDNRSDWNDYTPKSYNWKPRSLVSGGKRTSSSKDVGDYLARVPATAREKEIIKGDPQGIRFFEYASRTENWKSSLQLAYLAWKTKGIQKYASGSMTSHLKDVLTYYNLNDDARLEKLRVTIGGFTCCPLCRKIIEAKELIEKVEQAPGREVFDLTITEANLFHLIDLKPGEFNHGIYKLGWGHHHCNAVARDIGIENTLRWMEEILIREKRVQKISKSNTKSI